MWCLNFNLTHVLHNSLHAHEIKNEVIPSQEIEACMTNVYWLDETRSKNTFGPFQVVLDMRPPHNSTWYIIIGVIKESNMYILKQQHLIVLKCIVVNLKSQLWIKLMLQVLQTCTNLKPMCTYIYIQEWLVFARNQLWHQIFGINNVMHCLLCVKLWTNV